MARKKKIYYELEVFESYRLLAMVAILLSACNIMTGALGTVQGSGNLVAESRQVRNFDRLSLNGSGEVIIT